MGVLRVADHVKLTDTGRQRRANEDAAFARAPLFAVADGMGGAQAGEIASGVAVSVLEHGLPDGPGSAEERLAGLAREANLQIHELSVADADRAGMGTTLTAAYLGEAELAIAHVGDSRLYCLRDGQLQRLTRDHSLVEELVQEGRLTPEEADEHPQRSIITRALGPEHDVLVDHMSWRAQDGDVYLICSDGLTSMVPEARVAQLLGGARTLRDAAHALIDAANEAGGRDNITVVLFRVEELDGVGGAEPTMVGAPVPTYGDDTGEHPAAFDDDEDTEPFGRDDAPAAYAAEQRLPRAPDNSGLIRRREAPPKPTGWRRTLRNVRRSLIVLAVLFAIGGAIYAAVASVYFVGADRQGFITLYRGLPYRLPLGINLYTTNYTSGVPLGTLPDKVQTTVTDHKLRKRDDAADLITQIEQDKLAGQAG
jgi:PPM family protein phosphatase